MAKVFVTQETSYNLLPAEKYGEIMFITIDDFNNTRGSLHNAALLEDMRRKLRRFNPQDDWILPVGSVFIAGMVFMTLGVILGHTNVNVLRWSNKLETYIPLYLRQGETS